MRTDGLAERGLVALQRPRAEGARRRFEIQLACIESRQYTGKRLAIDELELETLSKLFGKEVGTSILIFIGHMAVPVR